MSLICLDYFKYEWAEPGEQNTIYHNCIILRPFGPYRPGQTVEAIVVQCTFILWKNEEDYEEEVVTL